MSAKVSVYGLLSCTLRDYIVIKLTPLSTHNKYIVHGTGSSYITPLTKITLGKLLKLGLNLTICISHVLYICKNLHFYPLVGQYNLHNVHHDCHHCVLIQHADDIWQEWTLASAGIDLGLSHH